MARFRFDTFVVDTNQRSLLTGQGARPLQPQVFDLLVYLIDHRDRVVSKDELLDALWRDTTVTDASLQRAVSLARQALDGATRPLIETHARRGYRFTGDVAIAADASEAPRAPVPPAEDWPAPRYVQTDDGLSLAYRILEQTRSDTTETAAADIVVIAGWSFPMDGWALHPTPRAALRALTTFGRVLLFDRRGVGLSDRVKRPASLPERGRDLRAVLRGAACERALLLGFSEGAPLALYHAAEDPERVAGLVLVGGFSRMTGHDAGWTDAQIETLRAYTSNAWGHGATVCAMFPDRAEDVVLKRWADEIERRGASPGAARDLLDMNLTVDACPWLSRVVAPAVVLHHREDQVIAVENGRELARGLARVRYIEASGTDHVFLFDDRDLLVGAVQSILASRASG